MAPDPYFKNRLQDFKAKRKSQDEMRRQRNEQTVKFRKTEKAVVSQQGRNVPVADSTDKDGVDRPLTTSKLEQLLPQTAQTNNRVQTARKLLSSDRNRSIGSLISGEILPILAHCLECHTNTALQLEAACLIANIALSTSLQTDKVVQARAVPLFIHLLHSPQQNVCEQAAWALRNIIADDPHLRDYVIQLGVVNPLLYSIDPDIAISFLRTVTWVIADMCVNKALPIHTVKEILSTLNILIHHDDVNILVDTVRAVSYLTHGKKEQIQIIIVSGFVPKLVPLLSYKEGKVQAAALRAIGNIITATNEQTMVVLNCGILSHFTSLLTHPEEKICKEAVWVLFNITADKQYQVQAVIDAGLLPKLICNLSNEDFETQKMAARAIRNLTVKSNGYQVDRLFHEGVIPPLCDLLNCKDEQVVLVLLDAINYMFKMADRRLEQLATMIEECGGLDKMEKLQNHNNIEIYKLAYTTIEQCFSVKINK